MVEIVEQSSEAALFEQELRRYPSIYFDYLIENIQFANLARYEMQGMFVYRGRDIDSFFRQLNEFLTAAANVSRVLWDIGRSKERHLGEVRTKILQELLGLDSNHPLSNRDWRNHIAHYETRIDQWLLKSKHHNIARRIIGPIGSVISGLDEHEIFEQYDPQTHTFYFRGEKYLVNEIHSDLNEVGRLVSLASRSQRRT